MSIVEFARHYQISDMTVRRRIKTGKLQAVLRNGKYYIALHQKPNQQNISRKTIPTDERSQAFNISNNTRSHHYVEKPNSNYKEEKRQIQTRSFEDHMIYSTKNPFQLDECINQNGFIPENTREQLLTNEVISFDSKHFLSFYEKAIKKVLESEKRTIEEYKNKLNLLNSQILLLNEKLSNKSQTIEKLQDKIEDLECLVEIIEEK